MGKFLSCLTNADRMSSKVLLWSFMEYLEGTLLSCMQITYWAARKTNCLYSVWFVPLLLVSVHKWISIGLNKCKFL